MGVNVYAEAMNPLFAPDIIGLTLCTDNSAVRGPTMQCLFVKKERGLRFIVLSSPRVWIG